MFSRIAIVNRGEAAVRLIHAVRDHNASGGPRLQTIALYTDSDATAMFVREADIAYPLGPASARPYLDLTVLERALIETGADAVWVGWGFVAEDPAFVDLCNRLGVTFIGPSADAMRKLGDKIGSKLIAEEVGVPVAPWSRGGLDTLEDAVATADSLGYPLMLKASAGGGGRGIRKVADEAELRDVFQRTREEAERAFGSGVVFLESLVTGARHVEVQVIADGHGTAWAIGVRDCSVQRRNQKVIEESASPLLTPEQAEELKASAERLVLAVGYQGAGTVEFLYQPELKQFAFLEVNTRLQVEHPITESTTGVDLVRAQLHVAAGGRLEGERPVETGHAVEARLNAEDPDRDFAPAPGRITLLEFPTGPGIRVDTGVGEGDSIPADFDSMIAKIIAHGRDRDEALARLRRAVSETTVVIEGGATNKSFVLQLLREPEVISGEPEWAATGWIDQVRAEGRLVSHEHSGVALVAAGIDAYVDELQVEVSRLMETARGGRPQVQHQIGRPVDLKLRGVPWQVTTVQTGPHRFSVTVAGAGQEQTVDAEVERLGEFHGRLTVNGRRHRIVSAIHGPTHLVEVDEVIHRVSRDEGGVLRAPSPALVVATPVAVGDEVPAGGQVLVLEAMKMETVVHAPFAARVRELLVRTGSQVETGAPLVRLEPTGEGETEGGQVADGAGPDLDLPAEPDSGSLEARADSLRAALETRILGYDVPPGKERDLLTAYLDVRAELRRQGVDTLEGEIGLLGTFADLAELSRNRPGEDEERTELRVHSAREHFHTYLQSLDVERGALPETFSARLGQVLSHYGVTELTRSEALEEAVFRVFLAQQRSARDLQVVTALLQAWIGEPPPPTDRATEARAVLERMVRATQLRHPVLGDLARSVRFRWFDQQMVDAARESALDGVAEKVAALAESDDSPQRAAGIEEIAAIPVQIAGILSDRLEQGVPRREPLVEVLVRRHYREFDLHDVQRLVVADRELVTADYVLDERPTRLITTVGTLDELRDPGSDLVAALTEQAAAGRASAEVVMDLYLHWPGMPETAEGASEELAGVLADLPFPPDCRRIAVAGCPGGGREIEYLTFRPDGEGGTHEDTLVRGVHPMVGRRLDLWRLREFDITRIEAPDDVLLYECVARSNPADRRLVALAQVRQLSVIRDESGAVVGMPQGERAVESCLEAIRRARTARGAEGSRLDTNHVWIQVWPVIEAAPHELASLQQKITPLTERAGLEEVVAQGRVARPDGTAVPVAIRFHANTSGPGVAASFEAPPTELLQPMDDYAGKVLRSRRRGLVYPYELADVITGPDGTLVEHDLDESGRLVPVDRPRGLNSAAIIAAVVTTPTELHPEGITRVVLCGDPTKALGALSEPECARVIAAIDLAEEMGVPLEWFALSAGARVSMDSGTENMDWVAEALKRVVEFTQDGGEINVVVAGINVGAQPYWNAEATMLMHTKGILVMTPDSAMVLTGKQSLDFSGGVSAEDNFGIGGYDRVMGPNGQAQYWARDLAGAVDTLMAHYEHTYTAPGEDGPRRKETSDPVDRDVTAYPHNHPAAPDFTTVGDIFSAEKNPDRKKAFDIRTVMAALVDQDHATLERWAGMADADTAVVQDAHIGGHSVCLLGIESRPVPRHGFPPTDGPDTYTAGTLFPRSSKKAARAINAASGNRPLVVLANLSGFDGSPDSMRHLQLEYGAEIGRAIVNFDGPIVFCVISRYHGGAFVVFSKRLNPRMTVLAIEGSFASVLGGAPAAAVVFAGEVEKRAAASPQVRELEEAIAAAPQAERAQLTVELADVRAELRAEKISEVAAEFDAVHNIHRAVEVGSVDAVIAASQLRPAVIASIEGNPPRP